MKISTFTKFLTIFFVLPLFILSCEKPNPTPEPEPDTPPVEEIPTVSIEAGEATANTLSFTVTTEYADKCSWLCVEADQTLPDDIYVLQKGMEIDVNAGPVACTANVEPDTEYAIVAAILSKKGYQMETIYMKSAPAEMPTVSIELDAVAPTFIKFNVSTTDANKCAWVCIKATESKPSNEDILNNGTPISISEEAVNITASSLEADTEYIILAAVRGDGGINGSSLTAKTEKNEDQAKAPTVTLTAGEVTVNEISFSISATDALTCSYIISRNGDELPTVDDVLGRGTPVELTGGSATVKISSLESNTEFIVSVAAAGNGGSTLAEPLHLTTLKDENAVYFSFDSGYVLELDNPAEGEVYVKLYNSTENKDEMVLDFYCDDNSNGLQAGTYSIDNSKLAGTLDNYYSTLTIYSDSNTMTYRFASGTAHVTKDGSDYTISMDMVHEDGTHYIGKFNGKLPISK